MSTIDYYAILGVLPDAEDVVIRAAYKALAQRYHPDRWQGNPDESHRRMSEINSAFAVLGNSVKRREYDKVSNFGSRQADYTQTAANEHQGAFTSALDEVEDRWQIACEIFPDLTELRLHLSKLSSGLAFAFVMQCLDSKAFSRRVEVARHIEQVFLKRYFGDDPIVTNYARSLVLNGQREAALWLNRLIDVMGSEVDAGLLIARVDDKFGFAAKRELARRNELLANLCPNVLEGSYYDSVRLVTQLGYRVGRTGGGFFKVEEVVVESLDGTRQQFKDPRKFVEWAQQCFCRLNNTGS